MSVFMLDVKSAERQFKLISEFSDGRKAEETINEYLRGRGVELIEEGIQKRLPESGRKPWPKKAPAARTVNPFRKTGQSNLEVNISTNGKYHYLYFPDDGSNTIHHRGNQQFMFFGAKDKSEQIGEEIAERLVERLEEG